MSRREWARLRWRELRRSWRRHHVDPGLARGRPSWPAVVATGAATAHYFAAVLHPAACRFVGRNPGLRPA